VVDRIKINTLTRREEGGRAVWCKRRRRSAKLLIPIANAFYRAAGNPVQILGETRAWHAWEIACLSDLHGGRYRAWSEPAGVLCADEVPGTSLSSHLDRGSVTEEMFVAAAREFRRAHEVSCARFPAGWSHGDPHSGNVIFDEVSGEARLIDFEVQHYASMPATARHTDDLLVFLQDTLGRLSRARWIDLARLFVNAYGRPEITSHLVERLTAPRGIARLWWAVRTTYLAPQEIAGRLDALRQALAA
jgi:hypothetical protein